MTPDVVTQIVLPARISIREQIATRILDYPCPTTGKVLTTQSEFDAWMTRSWYGIDKTEGKALVSNQATAKAMIATFIEERLKALDGVWFGNSDTHFTLGLKGRPAINVVAPAWMSAYIRSFPILTVRAPRA